MNDFSQYGIVELSNHELTNLEYDYLNSCQVEHCPMKAHTHTLRNCSLAALPFFTSCLCVTQIVSLQKTW